jgi:hypothetical protein
VILYVLTKFCLKKYCTNFSHYKFILCLPVSFVRSVYRGKLGVSCFLLWVCCNVPRFSWFFYLLCFPIYIEMLNRRCLGFHNFWPVRQTLDAGTLDMVFGVLEFMTASIWANYYIFFGLAYWGQSIHAHFCNICVKKLLVGRVICYQLVIELLW